ncbi:MAG: hypothetical protein Q4G16_13115 [Cruoricaptor ignavus]|nr:hypothetical protein [Cruoricaptor ignavus]
MKIKVLLFVIPILFSCQSEKKISSYPKNIGDIEFDSKTDNPNFKLCFEKYIFQYFDESNELQKLKGEKIELDKIFFDNYKNLNLAGESGLIRIRFIVNCKGEADRFRLLEMDENYKPKMFDKKISNKLLQITKNINLWNPKVIQNHNVDYYQYLIFKIKDGNLIEIMP